MKKYKTYRIYGQMVECVQVPRCIHPRLLADALPERQKRSEGAEAMLMTHHTLYMTEREKFLPCPFDGTKKRGIDCHDCPHNLRKRHCGILPTWTVECGRFDARRMSVQGDGRWRPIVIVVADMDKVREMEEYAHHIPAGESYCAMSKEQRRSITKELLSKQDDENKRR